MYFISLVQVSVGSWGVYNPMRLFHIRTFWITFLSSFSGDATFYSFEVYLWHLPVWFFGANMVLMVVEVGGALVCMTMIIIEDSGAYFGSGYRNLVLLHLYCISSVIW